MKRETPVTRRSTARRATPSHKRRRRDAARASRRRGEKRHLRASPPLPAAVAQAKRGCADARAVVPACRSRRVGDARTRMRGVPRAQSARDAKQHIDAARPCAPHERRRRRMRHSSSAAANAKRATPPRPGAMRPARQRSDSLHRGRLRARDPLDQFAAARRQARARHDRPPAAIAIASPISTSETNSGSAMSPSSGERAIHNNVESSCGINMVMSPSSSATGRHWPRRSW